MILINFEPFRIKSHQVNLNSNIISRSSVTLPSAVDVLSHPNEQMELPARLDCFEHLANHIA